MDDLTVSGASFVENMTPQYKNLQDWNKQHVNTSNNKHLFPQVMAPSIEFTNNENSASLNYAINQLQQSHNHQDISPKQLSSFHNQQNESLLEAGQHYYYNDDLGNSENSNPNVVRMKTKTSPKNLNNISNLSSGSLVHNVYGSSKGPINIQNDSKRGKNKHQEKSPGFNASQSNQGVTHKVEESHKRLRAELLYRRNQELEKEFKAKDWTMKKMHQENLLLGERISEMEERCTFLSEKYKDSSVNLN